jgi:DAK2 domain fusion protein YloV
MARREATGVAVEALQVLDAGSVRRWCRAGRDALAAARTEIDAINVYPVPDGDTGTNLYLTLDAAVHTVDELPEGADLATVLRGLATGALLGARGNSGVIVSQLFRGLSEVLGTSPRAGGGELRDALKHATDLAYAAVAHPVEGTLLTVARAAADAAAGVPGEFLPDIAEAASTGARAALVRTPDQLTVLRQAGVVDAGGQGLCEILDALAGVVNGIWSRPTPVSPGRQPDPLGRPAPGVLGAGARDGVDVPEEAAAFEVIYLLDADEERIPPLRDALDELGDSLVVVGGDGLWNVHVHVEDAGAAVEAGIAAGRPHRIRITHFGADHRRARRHPVASAGLYRTRTRGVVAVVAGDGLAQLLEQGGASVVPGGAGHRASTDDLLDGIRRARAREVVVLPNDADSLAGAEAAAAAAREEGVRVAVLPTRASVQALAALAVHEPARRFDDDVVRMTAAAGHTRHGGVTVAARDGVTMAGVCRAGEVLGIIEGDFALIGQTLEGAACTVVDRLLSGGGELVTLLVGADAHDTLARAVVAHLHAMRPDVETVVYAGGQPRYPLLIGVE